MRMPVQGIDDVEMFGDENTKVVHIGANLMDKVATWRVSNLI